MTSERYFLFPPFVVDVREGSLRRDAQEIPLRPKTFAVLRYFLEHPGQLVSKDELLQQVWAGTYVNEGALTVCVNELRKALGDDSKKPRFLATVPKRGYRFIVDVQRLASSVQSPEERQKAEIAVPFLSPTSQVLTAHFVGREHELSILRSALADASAGQGRLVLLAGEAGIGKTRLAEELITEAREHQFGVLVGRCYDDDSAPPFWPWGQVIRACIATQERSTVQAAMGTRAAVIAQVVPEVGECLAQLSILPNPVVEHARFQFFDSYTLFLKNIATSRPFIILLDDLHWADPSSLFLLQFLIREVRYTRLLIIGTYRDLTFDPAHPFAHTLGELARHACCQTLVLRGLAENDVAQLVSTTTTLSPTPTLISAIHAKTGGNPFFVTELVRMLAQEGATLFTPNDEVSPLPLPQRVRAAIERRVETLSAPCQDMVMSAAAIGQEFTFPLLAAVRAKAEPSRPLATLLTLLDEAVAARFLAPSAGGIGQYSFTHALIRETLYAQLGEERRAHLHRQIGEALEQLTRNDSAGEHFLSEKTLTELALHFFLAAPGGEHHKAIHYAIQAGERAVAHFAYAEAATQYARALHLLEITFSDQFPYDELLLRLGDAQRKAGNAAAARATFRRVADLAHDLRKHDDAAQAISLLARAALGFATGFGGVAAVGGVEDVAVIELLEEALVLLGEDESPLRTRVMSRLAVELYWSAATTRRISLSQQAMASARRLQDPATLAYALNAHHIVLRTPGNTEERLAIATEMMELAEKVEDKELILRGQLWRLTDLLELGDLQAADSEIALYVQRAEELQQPSYLWFFAVWNSTRMWLRGNFAEARRLALEALAIGQRAQDPDAEQCFVAQILGQCAGVSQLDDIELPVHNLAAHYTSLPVWRSALALVYADLGVKEEAQREYDPLVAGDFAKLAKDEYWMVTMSNLAQVSLALDDFPRIAAAYTLLRPYADRCIVVKPALMCLGFASRLLGRLAAALKRWDEAETYFGAALQRHIHMQAKPLITVTQEQYAAMLCGRNRFGDRKRAKLFIEEAFASAQTLGMNVALKRIQALQERTLRLV